ncbi:MAG: TIGR04211 family SH3 domain-containing protein [Lamprobacter sp.]|uniref:TIGR04211 family SH3 domain-containing protein n=1 Tax=Lamprobacter sp. TaxID=3100796 RepID=UPI002B258E7C|nr:TIGR04211 family SH3 domain-containing protein [Lamprobacter sp.]MEA3639115.1 TIGR04211 family SH3 domain-containing protein [Lamprobacter sp.]
MQFLPPLPQSPYLTGLCLAALLTAWSAGAFAANETRYVTDQYNFNLRSGESTRYKILRQLPSGTPLTVLSVNRESGYARVRTAEGLTGYIMLTYLQDEPSARNELESMRNQLAALQEEPDKLAARLSALQNQYDKLEDNAEALKRDKQDLEAELAEIRHAATNAVQIDRERRELQQQVSSLLLQVDQLEHRNLELSNQTRQDWFLIGAAVVAGGILIGLILPSLRLRRRRSPWSSSSL